MKDVHKEMSVSADDEVLRMVQHNDKSLDQRCFLIYLQPVIEIVIEASENSGKTNRISVRIPKLLFALIVPCTLVVAR